MTGADMGDRPRQATATTWTTTPTTWRQWWTHLDLQNAIHIGHSTGGGEVTRYLARHGESRVAKAVLISSVPPLMVQTPNNPGGLPKEVFDGFQEQVATNRAQFYVDLPTGPFYGYNRPGAKVSQGIIQNWWRQGMMGGAKAHYDGIVAFSQTDFTEDLKEISLPVLVMHGDDDQIVPYADSGPLSAKLVKNGTLKTYHGFPHGMPTTEAATINADLLAFIRASAAPARPASRRPIGCRAGETPGRPAPAGKALYWPRSQCPGAMSSPASAGPHDPGA